MAYIDPELKTTERVLHLQLQNTTATKFYNDPDILVLDNVLSIEDCKRLVAFITETPVPTEQEGWGERKLRKRICYQSQELSELVMKHCPKYHYHPTKNPVPHTEPEYWVRGYINKNWRFVECKQNSRMAAHLDGTTVKSVDHRSFYTVMLYLQDSDGDLQFHDRELCIEPKAGRLVVFNQQLLHSGLKNTQQKYFCRSEILYHREHPIETKQDRKAIELFQQSKEHPELEEEAFKLSPLLESMVLGV